MESMSPTDPVSLWWTWGENIYIWVPSTLLSDLENQELSYVDHNYSIPRWSKKHAPFPQWTFLAADQPIFQLLRPDVDWCYWRPAALPLLFWKKKQKMIPYKTLILSWSGCSMASRCQFSFWDYNFQHCWRQPGPAWQAKASWPIWTCTQWLLCHCHLGPIHFDINMSTGGNFEYGNVAFLGCDWKIG